MYNASVIKGNAIETTESDLSFTFDNEREERNKRNVDDSEGSAEILDKDLQYSTQVENPFITEQTLKIGPLVVAIWKASKTKFETNYTIDLSNVNEKYYTGKGRNRKLNFYVELSLGTKDQATPLKERDDFSSPIGQSSVTRKQSFNNVNFNEKYIFKIKVIYQSKHRDLSEPEELTLSEDVIQSIKDENKKPPNEYPFIVEKKLKVGSIVVAIEMDLKPSKNDDKIRLIGNATVNLANKKEYFTGNPRTLTFKVQLKLVPENNAMNVIEESNIFTFEYKQERNTPTRRFPFLAFNPEQKYSLLLSVIYDSTNPELQKPEEFLLSKNIMKSIEDSNEEIRRITTPTSDGRKVDETDPEETEKTTEVTASTKGEEESTTEVTESITESTKGEEESTTEVTESITESTKGEEETTAGEEEPTTGEEKATTGEEKATTGEEESTTGEEETTTGEEESTTEEEESTTEVTESTKGEEESTTGDEGATTGEEEATTGETESTTEVTESTTGEPASITKETETTTEMTESTGEETESTTKEKETNTETTTITAEETPITSDTTETKQESSSTEHSTNSGTPIEVTTSASQSSTATSDATAISDILTVVDSEATTEITTTTSETDEITSEVASAISEKSSTPLIVLTSSTSEPEKPSTTESSPTTLKSTETTMKSSEISTKATEVIVETTTVMVTDNIAVTTEAFINFTEAFIKDVQLAIGTAKTKLFRPFPLEISFSYNLNINKLNEIVANDRYRRSVPHESDSQNFTFSLETVIKSRGQPDERTILDFYSLPMNKKDQVVSKSHTFENLHPHSKYAASLRAYYHTRTSKLPAIEEVVVSRDVVGDIAKINEAKSLSSPSDDNSWKIAVGSVAAAALLIILIAVIVVRSNKRKLKHNINSKNIRNGSLLDNSVTTLPKGAIAMKEYPKNGVDNEAFEADANSRCSTLSGDHFVVTKYSLPINVSEFNTVYNSLKANSFSKICEEFRKVKQISDTKIIALASQRNARMTNNRLKNRFANIVPFDHSRVKLKAISDTLGSDYINANYIPGFTSKKEYIATQGPLRKTLTDFWRMICEQNISVIVNLTQSMEGDVVKCETYWPSLFENGAATNFENGSSQPMLTIGPYRITLKSENNFGDFTIRDLEVSVDKKRFVVKQYHLTQWPDFEPPRNTRHLLNLIKSVRKYVDEKQLDSDTQIAPILVHCSAGVGRTGTFIAVDRLYQELFCRNSPQIDVFGTVMDMRQHRVHMVQTEDQYIFIYECIANLIDEMPNGSNTIQSKTSKGSRTSYPSLPRASASVTQTNGGV